MPQPSITKIHLKMTYLKFHSNFPGANELNDDGRDRIQPRNPAVHHVTWSIIRILFIHPWHLERWWRHQMETFSASLAICAVNSLVTSEFTAQRPMTRSFDVFFDLHLYKRLSKQSWGWWFETPSRPLWCHSNESCDFWWTQRHYDGLAQDHGSSTANIFKLLQSCTVNYQNYFIHQGIHDRFSLNDL